MQNQRHQFALDPNVCYLNGAAYSPSLNRAIKAASEALLLKGSTPFKIQVSDHFAPSNRVRHLFCELLDAPKDPERVAIIPAVSYGLAVVAANLHRLPDIHLKTEILTVGEEFPNNVYAFEGAAERLMLQFRMVPRPTLSAQWSVEILERIHAGTALVILPQVHWIYGNVFDLEAIGCRCREVGALLVLDLSQSLGIFPFNQQKVQADAIICAGYKWLLGAYGLGLAWFGDFFDEGTPLEESWMNRVESHQFSGLTRYLREYRPKAQRYNCGEYSQFMQMPMLEISLQQLLDWTPVAMQLYCRKLTEEPLKILQNAGFGVEKGTHRAGHLVALALPEGTDAHTLSEQLRSKQIFVSVRGFGLRVSTNVYNSEEDWSRLIEVLLQNRKNRTN